MSLNTTIVLGSSTSGTTPTKTPNWSKYAVTSYKGEECILQSTESPLDVTNRVRLARSRIANIYAGSGIVPNDQWPNREGYTVLVGSYTVSKTTESTNPLFRALGPVAVWTCVRFHRNDQLTAELLALLLKQNYGSYLEPDAATNGYVNLTNLMRGSVNPHMWS